MTQKQRKALAGMILMAAMANGGMCAAVLIGNESWVRVGACLLTTIAAVMYWAWYEVFIKDE